MEIDPIWVLWILLTILFWIRWWSKIVNKFSQKWRNNTQQNNAYGDNVWRDKVENHYHTEQETKEERIARLKKELQSSLDFVLLEPRNKKNPLHQLLYETKFRWFDIIEFIKNAEELFEYIWDWWSATEFKESYYNLIQRFKEKIWDRASFERSTKWEYWIKLDELYEKLKIILSD